MKAERIGHGYRVLEDEFIYQHCLDKAVHFECCPTSSILTGSVSLDGEKSHPISKLVYLIFINLMSTLIVFICIKCGSLKIAQHFPSAPMTLL